MGWMTARRGARPRGSRRAARRSDGEGQEVIATLPGKARPAAPFPSPGLKSYILRFPQSLVGVESTADCGEYPINPRPPAIPSWDPMLPSGVEEEEIGKQGRKAH